MNTYGRANKAHSWCLTGVARLRRGCQAPSHLQNAVTFTIMSLWKPLMTFGHALF